MPSRSSARPKRGLSQRPPSASPRSSELLPRRAARGRRGRRQPGAHGLAHRTAPALSCAARRRRRASLRRVPSPGSRGRLASPRRVAARSRRSIARAHEAMLDALVEARQRIREAEAARRSAHPRASSRRGSTGRRCAHGGYGASTQPARVEPASRPQRGARRRSTCRERAARGPSALRAAGVAPRSRSCRSSKRLRVAASSQLAHGLTDDIITRLAKLRVLVRDRPRNHRTPWASAASTPREAGRILGVEYVVSGRVRRAGTARLRARRARRDAQRAHRLDRRARVRRRSDTFSRARLDRRSHRRRHRRGDRDAPSASARS